MKYRLRLSPNTRRDRERIVAWYDASEREQGDRFLEAFYLAAHQLQNQPRLGHIVRGDVRSWHLPIFPYKLWYRVNDDLGLVRVVAVVGDAQDATAFDHRYL